MDLCADSSAWWKDPRLESSVDEAGGDVLQQRTEGFNPDTRDRVWRGSEVPTTKQGNKVLGTPLGHEDFVREHLERTREKHRILLRRIPIVPDVQSAWLLLLHCASTRANYMLRVVRPEWALDFAQAHRSRSVGMFVQHFGGACWRGVNRTNVHHASNGIGRSWVEER